MVVAIVCGVAIQDAAPVSASADNFVTIPRAKMSRVGSVLSTEVYAYHPFTELVGSWRATTPLSSSFRVVIELPDGNSLSLGTWGSSPDVRSSIREQKIDGARVDTDTLVLDKPLTRFKVRIELVEDAGELPRLEELCFILTDPAIKVAPRAPNRKAHGWVMEPPRLAQMSYENGNVLCSPTSVAMVLNYWSKKRGINSLNVTVPQVAEGVYDPGWEGTGNWSFNVAYAATFPEVESYVTRMRDMRDAEDWTAAGVPIVTSVSYSLLKGEAKRRSNDGHLVVLVGFDNRGKPIFNDPGKNVVRMQYDRDAFDRAWAASGRTCYLIYPKKHKIPAAGPWKGSSTK